MIPDPDCRTGKHANCQGIGWDTDRDSSCDCPCPCHFAERLGIEPEAET